MDFQIIAMILALLVGFAVVKFLQAKLSLDARPRIPDPPNLPAGDCAVIQTERPKQLIKAIKALRELTGWNLRSAKWAVDSDQVVSGVSMEAAEHVLAILVEQGGGQAKIVGDSPPRALEVQTKPTTSSRCPYCHEEAGQDDDPPVTCTACLARHHEACWDEHRQCAGCGHTERYAGVEQTEGRMPRREGPFKG